MNIWLLPVEKIQTQVSEGVEDIDFLEILKEETCENTTGVHEKLV